jgi:glycosyltransferase involved in cell wall biosynthesis
LAFVFPSLDEGFGIPILEAFWFGKPVFTSNRASMPEIAGPFAYYWNSFDADELISVFQAGLNEIEQLNEGGKEDAKQYAAQFTWSNTAQKYLSLYRQLLEQ